METPDEKPAQTRAAIEESDNVYDFSNVDFKNCKNWAERYAACQIPEDILRNMSSEDLAETCINYPLYIVYLLFDDEQKGISEIIENFNGLQELSNRPDGPISLLKAYDKLSYTKEKQVRKTLDKRNSTLIFGFVEMLLAHEKFLTKFSPEELELLNEVSLKKYGAKLQEPSFGLYDIKMSMVLNAYIKLKAKKSLAALDETKLRYFVKNFMIIEKDDAEMVSKILTSK